MPVDLPYATELRQCVEQKSSNILDGVKAIARILNAESEPDQIDAGIADLAESARELGATIEAVLKAFQNQGWRAAAKDEFLAYANSDIGHVLNARCGIPISNAVALIAVCERIPLQAAGVNFPGMFLAQIEDHVIDPANFKVLDYEGFADELRRRDIEVPEVPIIASNQDILLRMFHNLETVATTNGDLVRAMEFIDYMDVITSRSWLCHVKRAEIWRLMGDPNSALVELRAARELVSEQNDAELVKNIERQLKRIARLSENDQVLN